MKIPKGRGVRRSGAQTHLVLDSKFSVLRHVLTWNKRFFDGLMEDSLTRRGCGGITESFPRGLQAFPISLKLLNCEDLTNLLISFF